MDDIKALGIVSALANGVNPQTGEVFDIDSPYQSADVIRALYIAVRALESTTRTKLRPGRTVRISKDPGSVRRCAASSMPQGRSVLLRLANWTTPNWIASSPGRSSRSTRSSRVKRRTPKTTAPRA